MKRLVDYILESNILNIFEESSKFDHSAKDIEDLFSQNIPFVKKINKDENLLNNVKSLLNDILTKYNGVEIEHKLIYTTGKDAYIKIPYAYRETIISILNNSNKYENFEIDNIKSNKIVVKYDKHIKILETGSGSLKTVNTRDQEVASCLVWNMFAESIKGVNKQDIINFSKDDINNIMKDIMESSIKFNNEWAYSFNQQIKVINLYLKSINRDPQKYKCERYGGDKSFNDEESGWIISKLYEKFISSYIKQIGGKKDNYDPTDIIIYNNDNKKFIIDFLTQLNEESVNNDIFALKEKFIKTFYSQGEHQYDLVGLSLKKITSKDSKFTIFNIGESKSPNEAYTIEKSDNIIKNGKIVVGGHFIFGNHIDSTNIDNDKVDKEQKISSHYCALTFRQFGTQKNGSPNIGMDVTMCDKNGSTKNHPSLGKVPVRDWCKEIFNDKKPETVDEGRKLLNDFMNSTDEKTKLKKLTFLIQEAIKVGPNCFPFVLIH